jgi:hypothetical protein
LSVKTNNIMTRIEQIAEQLLVADDGPINRTTVIYRALRMASTAVTISYETIAEALIIALDSIGDDTIESNEFPTKSAL